VGDDWACVDHDPEGEMSEWEDIEAIRQVKARYFRYLDTKQFDKWRGIFTDDCSFDGLTRPYQSTDEFVEGCREWLGPAVTVHHGHTPEVVLTGADSARAITAMFDWVEFEEPRTEGWAAGIRGFTGYGHYEEKYRREDGVWKIAFMRLTRLRLTAITSPWQEELGSPHLSGIGRDWLEGLGAETPA
jgi:hypothetical protein